MDDFTYLGLLCVAMFVGAFGAGYLPLTIKMSESKLRLVTIFGAGLLVGTALVVVIPEGISMHYEGQLRHAAEEAAASLQEAGAVGARLLMEAHDHGGEAVEGLLEGALEEEDEVTHAHPGHWQIGAALAFGFAFQLVVDRMSGGLHGGHAHGVVLPGGAAKDEHGCPASEASVVAAPGDNSAKSKSALVGMIVHAAVDGIALGAAVREGDSALSLLVFFAIMLHKAPSSFGLASYFLHHGITPEGVKKRLFVFSCAAPLGALCTYMLLSMSLLPYKQEMLAQLLLFSGGTFLYVATAHVLPEIQAGNSHGDEGHAHGGSNRTPPKMKWSETWLLVGGVLLPLLLDVHHGH